MKSRQFQFEGAALAARGGIFGLALALFVPLMAVAAPTKEPREVNAGPIWDQADAEKKCPAVAKMEKGKWTGVWRTVQERVSSVCMIEYPEPEKPKSKAERDKALREHAAKISAQNAAYDKAQREKAARAQAEREQAERDRAARAQSAQGSTNEEAVTADEAAALVAAMAGLFGQNDPQIEADAKAEIERQMRENQANGNSNGSAQHDPSPSSGYQKAYASSSNSEEDICYDMVQGTVAWNWRGDKSWNRSNVEDLCRETRSAEATVVCFEGVMAIHDDWSRASKACAQ